MLSCFRNAAGITSAIKPILTSIPQPETITHSSQSRFSRRANCGTSRASRLSEVLCISALLFLHRENVAHCWTTVLISRSGNSGYLSPFMLVGLRKTAGGESHSGELRIVNASPIVSGNERMGCQSGLCRPWTQRLHVEPAKSMISMHLEGQLSGKHSTIQSH